MATLKQRLHRKNASGTYDTIHFESTSDLILRPSGRTVEQDLADYLPEVQASDNVPQSLKKLIIGNTKNWINGKEISMEDHTHSASDITTGNLSTSRLPVVTVNKGGTGRSMLTSGYFLRGSGTGAVTLSSVTTVQEDLGINDLKTSVSEGKALIAAAVTDKGVQTAADATFQQIATNIGNIQTGPSYSTVYNFSTSKSYVEYEWTLPSDVFTSELYGILITFKYNMIVVNTDMPIDDESTIESKKTEMFIPFTKIPKFKSIKFY